MPLEALKRSIPSRVSRYDRQILLPMIGEAGQRRLADARVLLVGCGALGTVLAEQLVRAGVGSLRICDRDVVEPSNLQRQTLFDEADAREGLPKAVAAARRLLAINSDVRLDAQVLDVHSGNVESLLAFESGPPHLLLDGTDNAETRYLMNDVAVRHSIPWVYGACVGTEGRVMAVRPGMSACLRCVFPNPPAPGELATCDTVGVLGPAAAAVASFQSAAAIKLLVGAHDAMAEELITMDLWSNRLRAISIAGSRRPDCPACGLGQFEFLNRPAAGTTTLCGRDSVQIRPSGANGIDLDRLEPRLARAGTVYRTPYLLRLNLAGEGLGLTVFPDGRLIVKGTSDPDRARGAVARFIGM